MSVRGQYFTADGRLQGISKILAGIQFAQFMKRPRDLVWELSRMEMKERSIT